MATPTLRYRQWPVRPNAWSYYGAGGKVKNPYAFKPYQPPPVPAGSYDPSLDAQERAAGRGLSDLRQDVGTANTRDTVDYGLGMDAIQRGQTRGTSDLDTQSGRGQENYNRDVGLLTRSYNQLASRQQEGQNAAGVLQGGAVLQAAAKRAENMGIERGALDTNWNRAQQDIGTARTRLGEDSDLARGQLGLEMAPPDANNPLGGRRFQDRTTQLTRGEREGKFFGLDIDALRAYQASGTGYVPPQPGQPGGRPRNERVDAQGRAYRVITQGRYTFHVNPQGQIIPGSRKRRKK